MMKKILIPIILTLCLSVVALIFPAGQNTTSLYKSYKLEIDPAKPLTLDFEKARIRVLNWEEFYGTDREYVEVKVYDYLLSQKSDRYVDADTAHIKLKNFVEFKKTSDNQPFVYQMRPWISLFQFDKYKDQVVYDELAEGRDVEIFVPRNIPLNIAAEDIIAKGCLLKSAKSSTAYIKRCRVMDNFSGEGKAVQIEKSSVGKNAALKYDSVKIEAED
ncbi:MAG: hypothetical protein N2484_09555 [Clostridia bacterium]|nr:hypothetical protein [Clostridia bacterium]